MSWTWIRIESGYLDLWSCFFFFFLKLEVIWDIRSRERQPKVSRVIPEAKFWVSWELVEIESAMRWESIESKSWVNTNLQILRSRVRWKFAPIDWSVSSIRIKHLIKKCKCRVSIEANKIELNERLFFKYPIGSLQRCNKTRSV